MSELSIQHKVCAVKLDVNIDIKIKTTERIDKVKSVN